MVMLTFEKISQMKNITCHVLFFQKSSVDIFFTYLSKKYYEDIHFLEELKKTKIKIWDYAKICWKCLP